MRPVAIFGRTRRCAVAFSESLANANFTTVTFLLINCFRVQHQHHTVGRQPTTGYCLDYYLSDILKFWCFFWFFEVSCKVVLRVNVGTFTCSGPGPMFLPKILTQVKFIWGARTTHKLGKNSIPRNLAIENLKQKIRGWKKRTGKILANKKCEF